MREDRPLRVLSIIHPFRPAFSGEGEAWLRMIPALRRHGVEVEILTSAEGVTGELRTEFADGVPVHRVAAGRNVRWGRMTAIVRALFERRRLFDVALFHSPNHDAVYASCLLGGFLGWKTVYKMSLFKSDDCLTIRQTGRLGRLRVAALGLADGVICMSDFLRRTVEDAGIEGPKLLTAPNAIDMGKFRPSDRSRRTAARQRLRVPEGAKVVLLCGAVIRRKGVDILLEAWPRVIERVHDAVLLLVGPNHHDGFEEREFQEFSEGVERHIAERGLQRSVRLEGYQTDMATYYAAADVFVLPSRREGWPSVVNEAMASGLPCVVSWLDGSSPEHLRDGEDGVIVMSEDPQDYVAHIVRLLEDQEAALEMGRRARERVVDRFDVDRVAHRYATFLRDIAGRGSAPAESGALPASGPAEGGVAMADGA